MNAKKELGQYFTPYPVAKRMTEWALEVFEKAHPHILEPACGTGVFFKAIKDLGGKPKSIVACEIDKTYVNILSDLLFKSGFNNTFLLADSYFSICGDNEARPFYEPFDIIIGNPPFISHLGPNRDYKTYGKKICEELNVPFSKMMNIWTFFVLGALLDLSSHGKMAFIVPTEIINGTYANPVRTILTFKGCRVMLVAPQESIFPDTQQSTLVMLVEAGGNDFSLHYAPVKNIADTNLIDLWRTDKYKTAIKTSSWQRCVIPPAAVDVLRQAEANPFVKKLSELASVSVPPTSGANKFFTVNKSTIARYHLEDYALPAFTSPTQCPGILYEQHDWDSDAEADKKVFLLMFDDKAIDHMGALQYIAENGPGLAFRYKCKVRKPFWWKLPTYQIAPVFLPRRFGKNVKMIRCWAKAVLPLDRVMCVRMHGQFDNSDTPNQAIDKLVLAFLNPLTMLSAELNGKKFGGGALELTPGSASDLLIPFPDGMFPDIHTINAMGMVNSASSSTYEIALKYGRVWLTRIMAKSDIDLLTDAWQTLLHNRINMEKKDDSEKEPVLQDI